MLLSEFQQTIETLFPSRFAMLGDAIGLQVEAGSEISNVLVCLEVTNDVIIEALHLNCDAILTFHPLIFTPLARIAQTDRVGRLVSSLIREGVSLLCVHTAYDAFPQGTNHILASKLGLTVIGPLLPADDNRYGMGLVACTPSPTPIDRFVELIQRVCGGPIKFVAPSSQLVERVAIVAGSGMSFFDAAVSSGADTFLTADVKYHGFHAANDVIGLIDPGHFEMEQFVPEGLSSVLTEHVNSSISIHTSRVITNPVRYAYPQHNVYSSQPSGTV